MKRVFISQPMRGLTNKEIFETRRKAMEEVKAIYGEECEFIDQYIENYDPRGGCISLKYLAESIRLLADADVAYFCDGWSSARGCKIEYECANKYGIGVLTSRNNSWTNEEF